MKSNALSSLQVLFGLIKPHRNRLIIAGFALLLAAAAMLAVGQGLRMVIDKGFAAGGDPAWLNRSLIAMFGIIVLLSLATWLRFYNVSWLGERVTADLRISVFNHLLSLPPSWFEDGRTGDVISRLTADSAQIESVVGSSLSIALRNLVMLIGGTVMMFTTSVKLSGLTMIGVPLVVFPILLFGRRVRRLARSSQEKLADLGSHIDEAIHEIRIVQAYGHEQRDRQVFADLSNAGFAAAKERIINRSWLIVTVMILVFGSIALILWVGGHDVLDGNLSAGSLSAFIFYAVVVAGSVGALSEVWGDLQRAAGATDRLTEILNTKPAITAPETISEQLIGNAEPIRFNAVSFYYPSRPEIPALNNLSITVQPGETIALVGPSGAGKSTVFQLLLRFYDPSSGTLHLGNEELRRFNPLKLRQHFALVPQDAVIFATSVLDNVRYAKPEASEDEAHAACDAAYASEFITQLPNGYNTNLGERGVRLSGGQKQRISIARAILSNRPVLLLDEATSALDAHSEQLVQAALQNLMRQRTSIVIAHRLATVQKADRIIVMDKGSIVETGSHTELLAMGGMYAHLASLQFAK